MSAPQERPGPVSSAHHKGARAPSQRQLRVGELVRHAFAEIVARGEINDAELEAMHITVPEVRMSPDLKIATVYVMPLGGRNAGQAVAALARHGRFLRGEIARRVALKYAPELRFRLDASFAAADLVEQLLRSPAVARDLADGDD